MQVFLDIASFQNWILAVFASACPKFSFFQLICFVSKLFKMVFEEHFESRTPKRRFHLIYCLAIPVRLK